MIVSDSSNADGIFRNPKSWPPGFRFHPTEEELILYYLKRKICRRRIQLNVIAEVDVYKWDPEELPGQSVLKTEERQWFFFSPRDRKYPNGARSNRATRHGYWKATGKDRDITSNSRCVGNKKTLVFYKGRAPSGERTNWVMHEFTMDEEELKRCTNAKDYYALYKLYKKSGAGPKNGEQYGAPFREEDWTEDGEYTEPEKPIQEITVPDPNGSGSSFGDALVNPEEEPPSDDLDELLRQFVVESAMNDQIHNLLATPPPKVAVEIEPENLIMEPPFDGAASSEPSTILDTWGRQWEEENSWNAAQTSTSHLLSTEAPEVTSGLYDNYEQTTHGTDEVGFLEVDDLCEEKKDNFVPSTSLCAITNTSDISHFGQIDALNEPDIFHDAAMFLRDIGPIDQFSFLGDDNLGQLDYQPSSPVNNGDEHSGQLLWVHDQRCSVFESVQSEAQSASIGVINPSTTLHSMEMQNERGNVAGGNSDSWINSYVSTVLGSIPTRPALASENALINRAFERMSSFGRMRVALTTDNNSNPEVVAAGGVQRRVSRNKGLFLFSLLGLLCAVLWMLLIGTTMKVLKTFLGRFISS